MDCWRQWAEYIFQNGLSNVYHSSTDYLPLFHYILKLFGLLEGSIEKINDNIHHLKSIVLLFHFVTGFFLVLMIKKETQNWNKMLKNIFLFYLFNIAVIYNTVIWGQLDAILACLVFISCYFAFKKKVLASLIFIVLAINFKLQAIIFLPVVGFMILPAIILTFSIKRMIAWVFIPLIMQISIIIPFVLSGTLEKLWFVVTSSVGRYPVVSMHAYNIWDFLLSGDLSVVPDSRSFMDVSYKNWGLLMFFTTSGIALFPIARYGYLSVTKRVNLNIPLEKFLITCAIIPLLFFYFNTQMHERYAHPAFAFLIAYSLHMKKPFISVIGCFAYFLNLEGALKFMHPRDYELFIFNRDFISSLYLFTIACLYINLFDLKFKKKFMFTRFV